MSKPETVTVELTADEIHAVTNGCGANRNYTAAMDKMNTALAQHRRQRKRDALGLPWWVERVPHMDAALVRDNKDREVAAASSSQLGRAIVAGAQALDLLDRLSDGQDWTWDEVQDEVRAILKEAGLG